MFAHNPRSESKGNKMATNFADTPVRPAKKRRITEGVEYSTTAYGETMLYVTQKEVGPEAFAWNDEVEVLVLAESVERVGLGAFNRMPNLKKIDAQFATEVKLGQYCFSQLEKLESVELPMVSVPAKCFFECPVLKEVQFGGSCESDEELTIGERAFAFCGALEAVKGMPAWMVCEKYAFQECESLEGAFAVGGPKQENVPDGIFYGCEKITELEVQEGTVAIGQEVCSGCTNLRAVNLPESLMVISDEAFLECSSVEKIYLGKNMRMVGTEAFRDCSALIKVENRATERVQFGPRAFACCTALKSFTVPEKTEELAQGMFYGCAELRWVDLNQGIVTIANGCFLGCEKLHTCDFNVGTELEYLGEGCLKGTALREVYLGGSKVSVIGDAALSDMTYMTTLTLPNTLEKIGESMCEGCTGLRRVCVPLKVARIPERCFKECSGLEKVHIVGDKVDIEKNAFFGCDSIRAAIVGDKNTIWELVPSTV